MSNLSSALLLLITLPNRTLPVQPPVRLYLCLQTAAVLGYTPALGMLYILGANFELFLRFKGPASKETRIYPHDRLQGPSFKKQALPHGSACFDPPHIERPITPPHPTPSEPPFPTPSHPARFPRSSMAAQNRSHGFHVVSNRSPSRIRSVRLISLGMTTRPSSSILRTIPVARNVPILLDGGATLMPHCFAVCLCIPSMEFGGVIMRRKDLGHVSPDEILEKNNARPKPGMAPEKRFH